jgi:hypothetical protein
MGPISKSIDLQQSSWAVHVLLSVSTSLETLL